MRDHGYDLRAYAEKNWPTIGSKLVGKLHFSAGDMDDYWLNLAVYKFEDFLKTTTNPHYEGDFVYGRPMKGHAWHYATWAGFHAQGRHDDQGAGAGRRKPHSLELLTVDRRLHVRVGDADSLLGIEVPPT